MRPHSNIYASIALGALLAAGSTQARADDTATEIALLKAQLRRLEQRVAAQGRETAATRAVVQNAAAHPIYTKGPLPVLASTCPPEKFCYKGITITPGGFLAFETVYRDHALGGDVGSPFGAVPFRNSTVGRGDELRFSARQSRVSALIEGNVDPATKVSGYYELDFLGASTASNSNESNSFNPRIRHVYATVDQSDWGFHVLAGQTWSLTTMSAVGLLPRKENIPLTIDAQYVPGFVWTRQPQIRFVKDIGPQLQVGVSLENPQTTTGGTIPGTFVNTVAGAANNSGVTLSLNHAPDVVGKFAWDPKLAGHDVHVEGWGMGRDFYGRNFVAGRGTTEDTFAASAGGSVLVSVLPKTLDVQFSGAIGDGIGRYGTSGLPDVAVAPNGNIKPLSEIALLAGATWHATPMLDIYSYAGLEQVDRKILTSGATTTGYGLINVNNTGCFTEGGTCSAVTREVRQITVGAWDTIYKGNYGQLKAGAQYSYTEREAFRTVSAGVSVQPTVSENIFLTSLRYYPF